jgi:hypothetical protein
MKIIINLGREILFLGSVRELIMTHFETIENKYLFHTDPLYSQYVSNTLDTVTIMIVITPLGTILGNCKFLIPFNVISEEFNKNKATILQFTTKIVSRIAKIEQFVR